MGLLSRHSNTDMSGDSSLEACQGVHDEGFTMPEWNQTWLRALLMSNIAKCRYGGFDEGTYEQFEEYVKKVDEFKVKLSVPAATRARIPSCASCAPLRGKRRTRLWE